MEKGATLTLSLPCNNKKLPILLEASAIENGGGGVLHNGMSLFQDLKLKRRKVDSRCSSDGESIGTSDSASSLSPEAQIQNEGSPKDKERCITPEELVPPISVSKPTTGFTSQFLFMKLADSRKELKSSNHNNNNNNNNNNSSDLSDQESPPPSINNSNGVLKVSTPPSPPCNGIKANASVVVVKTEPSDISNGNGALLRSNSPVENGKGRQSHMANGKDRKSPSSVSNNETNGHPIIISMGNSDERNGNSSSDNESTASGSIRIKSEKHLMDVDKQDDDDKEEMETNKMEEDTGTLSSSPRSILSSASSTVSRRSPPGANSSICGSPSPPRSRMGGGGSGSPPQANGSSSTLIITKQNMLGKDDGGSGSQRNSPLSLQNGGNNPSRGSSPPHLYSSQPSPASMLSHMSHHLPPHSVSSLQNQQQQQAPVFHSNQLHQRLTESRRDREQREQREREAAIAMSKESGSDHGSPPLSVVTSTSLSFHQGSMYRINGVRPEVISGGAVTPGMTPSGTPPIPAITLTQHHPGALQSQQQQQQQQQHHISHQQQHFQSHLPPLQNGTGSNSPPGSFSSSMSNNNNATGPRGGGGFASNGISSKNLSSHYSYHPTNPHHIAHHPDLITGVSSRKSPTQLSSLSTNSRSTNSSPSNSSSSGSVTSGSSQHSPGSVTISSNGTIVAGGSLGIVNSSTGPSSHHHVNLNRTPTVIMGEAGGVRTMLWSTPGQPLANQSGLELGGVCTPGGGSSPGGSSAGSSGNGSIPPVTNGHSNGVQTNGYLNQNPPPNHVMQKGALSMELLWASEALNLSTGNGSSNTTNGSMTNIMGSNGATNGHANDDDDYEQPMICMICEDRATGLHYGIITCEGCKGFFKRTVQNRRVYTCVADGTCEITKAQRNRCQYCRFKKCIEQGMVLQAVREDRMPGGRNSGAVYNLYKVPVKYRKHKKGNRGSGAGGGAGKGDKSNSNNSNGNNAANGGHSHLSNGSSSANNSNNGSHPNNMGNHPGLPMSLPSQNGNILKAALTSPNEVHNMRQILPVEQAINMTNSLVQCDNLHDIAALHNWEELLEARGDLSDKLCKMGDSIVYRLVQWTKRLPFYAELPVDVHTRILTHKWHELLVLTTSAWQAMHTPPPPPGLSHDEETMENLRVLQRCLQAMMGRSLTIEQLRQDVGQMVERLTHLTRTFRRLGIRIEEYVCLKVISMLQNTGTKSNEVGQIQDRYIKVLRTFLEVNSPTQPNRLSDLLRCLPEVQAAASLLLESKMFYVPFLLNSALLQR